MLSLAYVLCAGVVFAFVCRKAGRNGWSVLDRVCTGVGFGAILVGLLTGHLIEGTALAFFLGAIPAAVDDLDDPERDGVKTWVMWAFASTLLIHLEWSWDFASILTVFVTVSEGLGISGVLIAMRCIKQRRAA